ncbi:phosphotriesterase family protein [Rhodoligotrophos defluvii]|uniref:phosphotriesterase family protein n=1 Tax=Rhodoligotrophos defluvii TaxID=2561934 RepID=UPI001484CD6B|nr:aryldialkylphosphatase [Rhodoligotrophos defluvii]
MTVLGPVSPSEIGITQMHEHMVIDFLAVGLDSQGSHAAAVAEATTAGLDWYEPITLQNYYAVRRNPFLLKEAMQLLDVDLVTNALLDYRKAGGSCIVEVTPIGVGRDPQALRRMAEATGLQVVMGTGFYVRDFQPPELATMDEDAIADVIVADIEQGAGTPAVRPGIIGEVGLSWPMHPQEVKALRAAAKAQRRTGLGLTIHPGRDVNAPFEAMRIVEEAGGDPTRTIICHLDRTIFEDRDFIRLAKTGCYCEQDLFGWETRHYPLSDIDMPNDAGRIAHIRALADAGHLDQVLVSHDVDSKLRLKPYGGEGYQHILENVVPVMKRKGFSQAEIDRILIENPRRVLTIQ